MPEMDAFELAGRIAAEIPGVRVLYTSGYTDAGAEGPFIQKPFTPAQLVEKVHTVLAACDGPPPPGARPRRSLRSGLWPKADAPGMS
jgi:DNA-binding response OmpR family regulator